MLRDAQVYPIWEGTTNVLALDVLRAMRKSGIDPLRVGIEDVLRDVPTHAGAIDAAFAAATRWLHERAGDRDALEAGARGLAMTLARTFAAALLTRSAARAKRDGGASVGGDLALFLDHGLSRLSSVRSAHAARVDTSRA
jgi:hypothetical protein